MAAKTSWHRYGTILHHCHPMCKYVVVRPSLKPSVYCKYYSIDEIIIYR